MIEIALAFAAGRLYSLYSGPSGEHVLRLKAPKAGLSAYSFTFG